MLFVIDTRLTENTHQIHTSTRLFQLLLKHSPIENHLLATPFLLQLSLLAIFHTVEPRHSSASLFVQFAICPTCAHNF